MSKKLKKRMLILFISSIIASAGLMALLVVAYLTNFSPLMNLFLLIAVVLTVFGWGYYYITRVKYQESMNPKKNKYARGGNRKNRRKGF